MRSPGWWATHKPKDTTAVLSRTCLTLAALAALLVTLGLGGSVAQAADIAYVATDVLNVRDAPTTEGAVIAELRWGEDVKIVAGPTADDWFQVVDQRTTGWVAGDYLSWRPVGAYDGGDGVGAGAGRWIDVDRSSQTVTLYEGGEAVASYWGALGWDSSDDGYYATANGTYAVYTMNAGLTRSSTGDLWFTHWVGFDPDRANGFHTFSMDADGNLLPGGDGPTGGCVALSPAAAAELFAFAEIGMTVEVHW